jgi:hypothetical protein
MEQPSLSSLFHYPLYELWLVVFVVVFFLTVAIIAVIVALKYLCIHHQQYRQEK